jgi:hypothetical protein
MHQLEFRLFKEEELIGTAVTLNVPLPTTWLKLTGRNKIDESMGKARVFLVRQLMTIALDQTAGFPEDACNHVVVYVEPISEVEDVPLAAIGSLNASNFQVSEEEYRNIEKKKFGGDPSKN